MPNPMPALPKPNSPSQAKIRLKIGRPPARNLSPREAIIVNVLGDLRGKIDVDYVWFIVASPNVAAAALADLAYRRTVKVHTFRIKKDLRLGLAFESIQKELDQQVEFHHYGPRLSKDHLRAICSNDIENYASYNGVLIFTTVLRSTTTPPNGNVTSKHIDTAQTHKKLPFETPLSTQQGIADEGFKLSSDKYTRPSHFRVNGEVNRWPPQHCKQIASAIGMKLIEINKQDVSELSILQKLTTNPSYAQLLDFVKSRWSHGERLTLAKHLAYDIKMPEQTRDYLMDLIDEVDNPSLMADSIGRKEHAVYISKDPHDKHDTARLQNLCARSDLKELEAEVDSSMKLLHRLNSPLQQLAAKNKDAARWVSQTQTVQQLNVVVPTIIGVAGTTGSGKSSVINAILHEERLVPTNGMRACTAVVTEMSWNTSTDIREKYRASIEFISHEDWANELALLFADMLDSRGRISSDCHVPDSEAAIALAKVKAVYPRLTNEMLAASSPEALLNEEEVKAVLSNTISIRSAHADDFYNQLQTYVDSAEKSTRGIKEQQVLKSIGFWPLIKLVRLYTKADALSTGTTLVDLPGIHDSNAARSAIAKDYIKQCTGLWIVAPITRAVDDKAAKNLLGESFKRQLKFDGTYSRVTFICSKTDDISITETRESLHSDEKIREQSVQLDLLDDKQEQLERDQQDDEKMLENHTAAIGIVNSEIRVWNKLKKDVKDGKVAYAPSAKRKRAKSPVTPRKKHKSAAVDVDENDEDDEDDQKDNNEEHGLIGPALTEEAIFVNITALQDAESSERDLRSALTIRTKERIKVLADLKNKRKSAKVELCALCISGRNQYSKGAIQQDFAAGIKELDEENQVMEDEDDFDADEDLRDYSEVASMLKVFCVSSRAYQKLSGRLTEIPQLRAYCKKLTEAGRAAGCKSFLTQYAQLMNAMTFWAKNEPTSFKLDKNQQKVESEYLKLTLDRLRVDLENAIRGCMLMIKQNLTQSIYQHFTNVIATAMQNADVVSASWGANVVEDGSPRPPMRCQTYKAVVRRNGVFSNHHGNIDFNSDLAAPIMKQLAAGWEKCFTRQLPGTIKSYANLAGQLLFTFHGAILARVETAKTFVTGFTMLSRQLPLCQRTFDDLAAAMTEISSQYQKDANRNFTPIIAAGLVPAYDYCTAETGRGQFKRMKDHMEQYIGAYKETIFRDSTMKVEAQLENMCAYIDKEIIERTGLIFQTMQRDYLSVISAPQVYTESEMSLRNEIAGLLKGSDSRVDSSETTVDESVRHQEVSILESKQSR